MKQEPLHSELVKSGDRNFFFDIRQSEKGSSYLTITMAQKQKEGNGYDRDKIVIFEHEMMKFGESIMRAMIKFRPTGREAIIENARAKYPNAFAPWSKEDDCSLADLFVQGKSIEDMAKHFGRNTNAISARIEKLNLVSANS